MPRKLQEYHTGDISVTFEPALCIHSARCLSGLPEVFDVSARPWVRPEAADADTVAEVVRRCPSGALKYERRDGGPAEVPDAPAAVSPQPDGPLWVRGDIAIQDAAGAEIRHVMRAALCRCGGSANAPFCDNTHRRNGFRAP